MQVGWSKCIKIFRHFIPERTRRAYKLLKSRQSWWSSNWGLMNWPGKMIASETSTSSTLSSDFRSRTNTRRATSTLKNLSPKTYICCCPSSSIFYPMKPRVWRPRASTWATLTWRRWLSSSKRSTRKLGTFAKKKSPSTYPTPKSGYLTSRWSWMTSCSGTKSTTLWNPATPWMTSEPNRQFINWFVFSTDYWNGRRRTELSWSRINDPDEPLLFGVWANFKCIAYLFPIIN